jgi:hypothetical protein
MRSQRSLLLASMVGLAVVAGCTTVSPGNPRSTDTSGSTPRTSDNQADDLPFAGAPKVNDPLDTNRYEQDPCKSLTSAQAQELTLPPPGEIMDDVALGTGCMWRNPDTRGLVEIVFLVDDPRGLSPEYDANDRGKWVYFDVLPDIEGYPAITRAGVDQRDIGGCTVVVGVADDMAFLSSVQLSPVNVGKVDPCVAASDVAGMALQTMKEGK